MLRQFTKRRKLDFWWVFLILWFVEIVNMFAVRQLWKSVHYCRERTNGAICFVCVLSIGQPYSGLLITLVPNRILWLPQNMSSPKWKLFDNLLYEVILHCEILCVSWLIKNVFIEYFEWYGYGSRKKSP